jgi:23S rRNA pseudouridine2605 synthase
MPTIRLSVYLSRCGISSRRKAEEIIASGKVKVNNIVVLEPQFQVKEDKDVVTYENQIVNDNNVKLYIALYKPVKVLSDLKYDDDRMIARKLIPIDGRLFPVGRLDYHSEGLMLFTNDGEFANRVAHPRFEVEKEYLVKVKGSLDRNEMKQMKQGIPIDGSLHKVEDVAYVKSSLQNTWYRVVVREGKNRMIRKIGEKLGHHILKLKRVRIGKITLGSLKPGEYRYIEDYEVKEVKKAFLS